VNRNEKRPPARDGRNPNCALDCNALDGCRSVVFGLVWHRFERCVVDGEVYWRRVGFDAVAVSSETVWMAVPAPRHRDGTAKLARWHRANEAHWAAERERQHMRFVYGRLPYRGRRP